MEVSGELHAPVVLPPGKDPHWTGSWVDAPVDAAAAQRVAEVALAQKRTNGAARPLDLILLGTGEGVLLQAGPDVETQILVA